MRKAIQEVLEQSPGLKGREIARKIGEDRKEVNSFLSKNLEHFWQNEEYQWFNKSNETIIEFETGWTDAESFERQLSEYSDLFSVDGKLKFVLPKDCNLLLESISRFLALLNQLDHHGAEIVLDMSECNSTKSFLDRAGFFDLLAKRIDVLPKRPACSKAETYRGNSENLVELVPIDLEELDFDLPEKLTKSFSFHAGEEYYGAAFTIFAELVGNVQEHSESMLPGFVALQVYKGRRSHIQTIISDSGLSISTTLKRNLQEHYPDIFRELDLSSIDSDIYLVSRALTKGGLSQFGSDPDGAGRGGGLKKTQKAAAKYNAEVKVRQPSFQLKLHYQDGELVDISEQKGLKEIKGTQVCFDFFLD